MKVRLANYALRFVGVCVAVVILMILNIVLSTYRLPW